MRVVQLEQELQNRADTQVPQDDLLAEQAARQAAEQALSEAQEQLSNRETTFSQALSAAAQTFEAEVASLRHQVCALPERQGCWEFVRRIAARSCAQPDNDTMRTASQGPLADKPTTTKTYHWHTLHVEGGPWCMPS